MQHHWSGWPGAHCLHCGNEDPMEIALADNDYDPFTNRWDSAPKEEAYKQAMICSGGNFGGECGQCNSH